MPSTPNSDTINVRVNISDRNYRLQVQPDDEIRVRKAANMVREKLTELQGIYEAKDKQDYLAMCALLTTIELLEKEEIASVADTGLLHKIDHLDQILADFLKSWT